MLAAVSCCDSLLLSVSLKMKNKETTTEKLLSIKLQRNSSSSISSSDALAQYSDLAASGKCAASAALPLWTLFL